MSRINTPENDSVFELWPLNVSTLQYLSMYFTFFKFLYRLNYMAYKAELDICDAQFKTSHSLVWVRVHQRRAPNPTQLSLRALAPQTQPI